MTSEQGAERATQLEVARKIALDLLAVRQRSEHELRTAMARRNVPQGVADEIVERFTEVGLLNDESFASALAASRSEFSLRGRHRIRQELQTKGIDKETAESVLAQIDPEDEREAALTVARKKARALSGLEPMVARRRLAGVLARRGFSGSVVSGVVQQVLGEWAELDADEC